MNYLSETAVTDNNSFWKYNLRRESFLYQNKSEWLEMKLFWFVFLGETNGLDIFNV